MNRDVISSTDARQTHEWGKFLEQIGWKYTRIYGIFVFIRRIPILNRSIIKIQHPTSPFPFQKIHTLAKKQQALFVVIEPVSRGFSESAFRKNGYRVSKLRFAHSATILLNLQLSLDELWKSFSENARRNIKKAERQVSITVQPLQNEKQIKEFYTLYVQLGKTRKFYVPSYHEVRSKMKAFQKSSYLLWAYDSSTGSGQKREAVAVLWVGSVNDTLVYFHPGNTKRGYELLANYLLVWEALKLGKKLKLRVFDFETAFDPRYPQENKQWKGYTEFKRKFGGEFIQYPPSFIRFYNPFMKYLYLFATVFSK